MGSPVQYTASFSSSLTINLRLLPVASASAQIALGSIMIPLFLARWLIQRVICPEFGRPKYFQDPTSSMILNSGLDLLIAVSTNTISVVSGNEDKFSPN